MNKIRCAIFDLDGTLLDTLLDVSICFNQALKKFNLPEHSFESYKAFVGGDLEQVVSRMLPNELKEDKNIIDSVKEEYKILYGNSKKENTVPYDGIMQLLVELTTKKITLCINSNKNHKLTMDCLHNSFPSISFDIVIGSGNGVASKPDPGAVYLIKEKLNLLSDEIVYIGDTATDVMTAKNANIKCLYVKWGQGKCTDTLLYENIAIFKDVNSLKDYIVVK